MPTSPRLPLLPLGLQAGRRLAFTSMFSVTDIHALECGDTAGSNADAVFMRTHWDARDVLRAHAGLET